ncbi:MAG: histidine kinase [Betaproteobacteria bacterium]|nr:histidine kinase [Betaproteobacteria bacterium]
MHPILADVRKLLWYLVAWLLVGVVMAGTLALAGLAPWTKALVFAVPVCVVFGFIAPSAYYVCRSLPLARRKVVSVVAVFGAASLLSGLAWLGICAAWSAILREAGEEWAVALPLPLAAMLFAGGVALYLLSIVAHDVLIGIENVRAAERRDAQSRLFARDAELQVLRTQINPHFLFNSLNSISALTTADGAAARAMTIELAQFFRQTLALSHQQKIPLAAEIALCRSFVAVEQIRFGSRLVADFDVADDALDCLVPPMVLQPLVENAIKHGIRDLVDGGVIAIRCFVRERWLHALVGNPVDADARPAEGDGVGLRNIRQRLATLYGERARITWARDGGRFGVEITVPLEHAESEAGR